MEGQRRNVVHLSLCDILMEAVHCQAHVQVHFYHTCGIKTTHLDEWCKETGVAIGSKLVTKDAATQVWEFAFSSANYVPTELDKFLDSHVCPVFSRDWIEQHTLDFRQVIATERQRAQCALQDKQDKAELLAGKCQNVADVDHVWQRHGQDEQRGQAFDVMLGKFALKGLAVFETPRQGNCVAWALHWMKTGQLPESKYQDDEVEKTEDGRSIIRLQRDILSSHWQQGRDESIVQEIFKMFVPEPKPFEDLSSSSPLSKRPKIEKPCVNNMLAEGVVHLDADSTQTLNDTLGALAGVNSNDEPSSSSSHPLLPGHIHSDSAVLPGAPESRTQTADNDRSAVLHADDVAAVEVNLKLVTNLHVSLPAEALQLMGKYSDKICGFCEGDSSALKIEAEAFVTACHGGLLQKFALPGIPEWKAFMEAVSVMLRILGVFHDAPLSFPFSKEFASAFAVGCLLCVDVKQLKAQTMFAAFISDHVDQLRKVHLHVQECHNGAHDMKVSERILFEFLSSLELSLYITSYKPSHRLGTTARDVGPSN